jgi:hypothetical protein
MTTYKEIKTGLTGFYFFAGVNKFRVILQVTLLELPGALSAVEQ